MNIFKLKTISGKDVLINFDNVTEVIPSRGGCSVYFNAVDQDGGDHENIALSIDEIYGLLLAPQRG